MDNIHLDTKDGAVIIDADKEYLANYPGNPLYRKYGVVFLEGAQGESTDS